MNCSHQPTNRGSHIAARVSEFIRREVIPYESDVRWGDHGPSDELVTELRERARAAGVLTPHLPADAEHLSHRDLMLILRMAGYSPLGPVAVNVAAPDEGNMHLLSKVASSGQKRRYLAPLIAGLKRSVFYMTEPAAENGAGSDPSMLKTVARRDGDSWIIDGRKAFSTGAAGAGVGIIMAKAPEGATMFLVDLPDPAIQIESQLPTIDSVSPGGHPISRITHLRVAGDAVLGEVGKGLKYAQMRLAPARLTHCTRWLGAAQRAQEIAVGYATRRFAFGKTLIEHEGVGFMLAENAIALKQAELMIDWCAGVLDSGAYGTQESSMTKVAVSEALFDVADRCVQVMGGTGVSRATVVERIFRELRAFRIYDGPTEVHKWSLARSLQKQAMASSGA